MAHCEELIAEYLDGSLSASGQEKLADMVRADDAARRRFVMHAEMAGLLANHFREYSSRQGAETQRTATVSSVLGGLAPLREDSELIQRTMIVLPDRPPQPEDHNLLISTVMERIENSRPRSATLLVSVDSRMVRSHDKTKQNRLQAAIDEFAIRSALETQAQISRIPRFGRWMSFAALLAMAAVPLLLFGLAQSLRTIAAVPVLRPISGNVYVISSDSAPNLERGVKERLAASDGVAVDSHARAAVTYWDGTRMELSGDSGRLWMSKAASAGRAPLRAGSDRRVLLESGTLEVAAAKQHEQPLVLVTPHAEVEVIGTKFVLRVGADETRVTVLEGQVRFIRMKDRQSISVAANEYAVAAQTAELIAKPLEPN